MIINETGQRLRKLREKKDVSQDDVAAALHTSRTNYTKMEAGERDLKTTHCKALADYFGVTCDYLIRGVEADNVNAHNTYGLSEDALNFLKEEQKEMRKRKERRTERLATMTEDQRQNVPDPICTADVINALLACGQEGADLFQVILRYLFLDFDSSRPMFPNNEDDLPKSYHQLFSVDLNAPHLHSSCIISVSPKALKDVYWLAIRDTLDSIRDQLRGEQS